MIVPNSPSLNNASEIKDQILISPLSLSKNKTSRILSCYSGSQVMNDLAQSLSGMYGV